MLTATLASLRAHLLRLAASLIAIVLGVGFVAGTLIFSDTAEAALYDRFARVAAGVDVAVQPPGSGATARLPASTVDTVRRVPGVAAAEGRVQP
ncbi:MAG: ABC transporter permease, partial [Actinocatenispora sp.]